MGSSRSPHKDGDEVELTDGTKAKVTDAGEFITHVQVEGDRYSKPVTNDRIKKQD